MKRGRKSKFDDNQKKEIISLFTSGTSVKDLAKKYEVSYPCIYGIVKGTKPEEVKEILVKETEEVETEEVRINKNNKDLLPKEKVDDPTMIDSTDVFIDEENGEIRTDGKATDSFICKYPEFICKSCPIVATCKKENKKLV